MKKKTIQTFSLPFPFSLHSSERELSNHHTHPLIPSSTRWSPPANLRSSASTSSEEAAAAEADDRNDGSMELPGADPSAVPEASFPLLLLLFFWQQQQQEEKLLPPRHRARPSPQQQERQRQGERKKERGHRRLRLSTMSPSPLLPPLLPPWPAAAPAPSSCAWRLASGQRRSRRRPTLLGLLSSPKGEEGGRGVGSEREERERRKEKKNESRRYRRYKFFAKRESEKRLFDERSLTKRESRSSFCFTLFIQCALLRRRPAPRAAPAASPPAEATPARAAGAPHSHSRAPQQRRRRLLLFLAAVALSRPCRPSPGARFPCFLLHRLAEGAAGAARWRAGQVSGCLEGWMEREREKDEFGLNRRRASFANP